MLLNDFSYLGTDRADRIERRHRILEDRGYLCTADAFPVLICLKFCQVFPVERDGSVGNHTVGFQHSGERLCEDGFSGTALAYDRESLSLIQIQRDTADRCKIIVPDPEFYFNVFGGQYNISIL